MPEAALIVRQRLFAIARLAAAGQKVTQIVEANRHVACRLSGVRIIPQQTFENVIAALVMRQRLFGIARLATAKPFSVC